MRFISVLAVSASLLALGYAAEPLAFTSWPKDIQAGKPVTVTWEGAATNEPVTLTLRKGNAGDLKDVETITAQAKDGTFTWTPDDNIEEGSNYAFQISQNGQSNYSGLIDAGAKADGPAQTTTGTTGTTGTTAMTAMTAMTTTSSASSTDSTSASTTQTTHTTSATSKPLINFAASVTPSSSPVSTSVVSSTVTAKGPFMTSTEVIHGKGASATGGMQSGAASLSTYSLELVVGAMGLLVYLVQ